MHSGVRVKYEVSRLQAPVSNHLVINGSEGEITAPNFFTEQSAPWFKVTTGGAERVVKRTPGNPYRKVVEDFAAATEDPEFVSAGTTVAEPRDFVTAAESLRMCYAALARGMTALKRGYLRIDPEEDLSAWLLSGLGGGR